MYKKKEEISWLEDKGVTGGLKKKENYEIDNVLSRTILPIIDQQPKRKYSAKENLLNETHYIWLFIVFI